MRDREVHVGDQVILKLSQDELAEELANMEMLLDVLQQNIRSNPKYTQKQKDLDCEELQNTFDVAMTAMRMVYLSIEGEEVRVEP